MSLPAVKTLCILAQDSGFGLLRNVLTAAYGGNDIRKHTVPVGIVRGKGNFVVTDAIDHVGESFFLRFGREEPVAVFDILAGFFLAKRRFNLSPLLPFLIHALDPIGNPTDAAFKKGDPQVRKTFRDAAIHQPRKLDESLHRTTDGMHEYETVETFFAGRPFTPVVNAERNVEPLELLIDRPEDLRSQVFLHSLGRNGNRCETEFNDGTVGFLYRRRRVLKR